MPDKKSPSEEVARLRGDLATFSRRLNHDLRTPLMAITAATDALMEMEVDGDSSRSVFLDAIAESANEISAMVEKVRTLAKASSEETVSLQPTPMDQVVWAAVERQASNLRKKNAELSQPVDWPIVNGVASWLEAIWVHLIENAIQHAGPAAKITLGWERNERFFRFWVDDNGPGVNDKLKRMLFTPFDQMHKLASPRGMGLAIVERLVSLQGGQCGYEAKAGNGSRFYFTLSAT